MQFHTKHISPGFAVTFLLILLLFVNRLSADEVVNPLPDTGIPDKIDTVVQERTLYYAVNDTIICTSRLYHGLMNDLELSAKIANILMDRKYEISLEDSLYHATDNKGLDGIFIVAHQSQQRHVFYGNGSFDKSLVMKVNGRAIVDILVAQSDSVHIAREMALYLKIDNGTVGFLAKVASKIPLLNKLVRKFATGKALSFAQLSRDIADKLINHREKSLEKLQEKLEPVAYQRLISLLREDHQTPIAIPGSMKKSGEPPDQAGDRP